MHSPDKARKIAWINGVLATMNPEIKTPYGLVCDHVLVTCGDKITSILPKGHLKINDVDEVFDLKQALLTPGLIDCHTHLIFGGNRAEEWEMRLNGASYVEISQKGGGINSTVAATRQASYDQLYGLSLRRLKAMMAEGVTTVEVKSGYGLDFETERKMLLVAKALKEQNNIDISPTLLAAHSLPKEYAGRPDDYIDEICTHILPTLWQEGLFEAADVFCENIAFNLPQSEKL
ncbi:MAG: imidazolonepropionase, partial [Candidatus Adiutrix sp.]